MRIAFFGTPEFAVPTLRALAATDHTLAVVLLSLKWSISNITI